MPIMYIYHIHLIHHIHNFYFYINYSYISKLYEGFSLAAYLRNIKTKIHYTALRLQEPLALPNQKPQPPSTPHLIGFRKRLLPTVARKVAQGLMGTIEKNISIQNIYIHIYMV